jgi:cobalt-zinc-cadmium efflux system membrane fusion protein
VGSGLEERTRLLRVVAEVANPDGLLKDGMFGTAQLLATATATAEDDDKHHDDKDQGHGHAGQHADKDDDHGHAEHPGDAAHGSVVTVAVPAAAVQAIDGKSYVFVAHEQDLFELRRVETGPRRAGEVLVVAGLKDGEKVAASQGFALKSELLKSRLGASCADH